MSNVLTGFFRWVCRLGLGGIFLYSGYVKLRSPLEFAAAVAGYQLLPAGAIYPAARYFPYLEIALGLLLLVGWRLRYWGVAASALILFFIAIMALTHFRGIEADCGCFGAGEKISGLTLARDSLLLVPALFLAWGHRLHRRVQTSVPAA